MLQDCLLEQATLAADQANWSLLLQYLPQLLAKENPTQNKLNNLTENHQQNLLNWALQILENGDFQERWEIAKIIPNFGTNSLETLIEIIQDEDCDTELRWFASRILAEFNCPQVIETLVNVLKTSQEAELNAMAANALANMGTEAIEALTGLLSDEESRLFAVKSLTQIRHPQIIEPLLKIVKDPHPDIRSLAIEALYSFHDISSIPVLIEALNDPSAIVRKEATIGIGLCLDLITPEESVKLLKNRLWDFNLDVCREAASALAKIKTPAAAEALFDILKSPSTPEILQIEIVRSLGWMATPEALEYLAQTLFSETQKTSCQPTLTKEIIAVLGRIQNPNLSPQIAKTLSQTLHSKSPLLQNSTIKSTLALALGQLKNKNALQSIINLLSDSDESVRLHAIAAIKQIIGPSTTKTLELLTQKPLNPAFHQEIILALQEIPIA
ncbi:MAG TPA: HEAT repeat domain-containing protein [Halomicronema sp.]